MSQIYNQVNQRRTIWNTEHLGKTGLKISRMGFGGIPIQKIDEEGTRKLLREMMEKGVNYIDSARGYTVSEQYIGYGLGGNP